MRNLFFKLYYAGLNNCRMSLDIGVALAYLTGRTLVPYNVKAPWASDPLMTAGTDYAQPATVLDLFDVPVPLDRAYASEPEIDSSGAKRLLSAPVYESVLRLQPAVDEEDFRAFRNGREHVFTLGEDRNGDKDLIVDVPTLGMYSYSFYVNNSFGAKLRTLLAGIRPSASYREFARRVADSLAPFNAVHIRRGDFRYSRLTPRAHEVTGGEVAGNLASRLARDVRLLVCTDSSAEKDWFAPLLRTFREVIFVDELILRQASWRGALAELPYHDDPVLGLITQLVAARAECFVGTLFSSFSAFIQRMRGIEGRQHEFLYCYSDWTADRVPFKSCEFTPVQDGPYTWNRVLYPVAPAAVSWLREWPESYQAGRAEDKPSAVPPGTVTLCASEAMVHGTAARYELTHLLDNIGYWNNCSDYVTWEIDISLGGGYRVEIRLACPSESAGSVYTVGLEGGPTLTATVQATGDWTQFSGWRALETMHIPAGRHTLEVRIVSMPAYAAMNLASVRLVPLA